MAYTLKYSNGKVLALLADQSSDSASTSLTLVGKNSNAYGESINNNFIHLLENFANRTAPKSPLTGQLWYDTVQGQLKVYSNNLWKPVGSPVISATQPTTLISGEFWFDTQGQRLWYYNGVNLVGLDKPYNDYEGKNGALAETVIDEEGANQNIINFYVQGVLVGWYSDKQITLNVSANPLHIVATSTIQPGFTLNPTVSGQYFHGTATSAVSVAGFSADQILTDDGTFIVSSSSFTVNNNYGISVGPEWTGSSSTYFRIYNTGDDTVLSNARSNGNTFFQYNNASTGVGTAAVIDASRKSIGLFTATVANNNSLEINGNLYVTGSINAVSNNEVVIDQLKLEEKILDLGKGQTNDAAGVDGTGIRVYSRTDKYWLYSLSNNWWYTDANINARDSYWLYGQYPVLSVNTTTGKGVLGDFIETAAGLKTLPTLRSITVGDQGDPLGQISVTSGTISSTLMMLFKPGTYADFNGKAITNIKPTTSGDAPTNVPTKKYVDDSIAVATGGYGSRKPYTVSIDVTDFLDVNAEVKNYLDVLLPVDGGDVIYYSQPAGARCSVLCSTYSATTATFVLDLSQNKIPAEYMVISTSTSTVMIGTGTFIVTTSSEFTTATTIVTDVAGTVTVTGPRPTVSYTKKLYQVIEIGTGSNATVTSAYDSNDGIELQVADATNIPAGAILSGNGYTQGQIVVEVLNTNTVVTNYPPNGIPAPGGIITFSSSPGFKGWVFIKDL